MTGSAPPPKRRKRSPRFADIAARAGVSPATVDRVLNERDSVSEATRRRVLQAAEALGIPRILPRSDHALVHVDILLPKSDTPFFRRLAAALRDGAAMLDRRVVVHRSSFAEGDAAGMAAALLKPPHPRAAVIFAAPDVPPVRAAVAAAIARGEKAVAVVSDLPVLPGLSYVGVDNRAAGTAAGHLMGRLTPQAGRIVAIAGSPVFRAHTDRQAGFRAALAQFPHLTLDSAEMETRDDPERCYRAVRKALQNPGPPVVGLYNSGAGSEGVARALARFGTARPNWIGHEVSEDHVAYLKEGSMDVAIDQDPAGQAIAALQSVLHLTGVTTLPPTALRGEIRIHTKFLLP